MDRYEELETCGACGGEGAIEHPAPQRDDPHYCNVLPCRECNGQGVLLYRPRRPEGPSPPIKMTDGECPF